MLRWTISCLLLLFSVIIIVANIQTVARARRDTKSGSLVVIIGGLLGAIGLRAIPVQGLRRWWWIPLILDIGCGPSLLGMAWVSLRSLFGRRINP